MVFTRINMPHYHCSACHHEWDGIEESRRNEKCDWCGAGDPIMLEKTTPLERLCKHMIDNVKKGKPLLKR